MMKKLFFMFAGLILALASCSDGSTDTPDNPNPKPDDNSSITLDDGIITGGVVFDNQSSEKSVSFTTTKDWTLSIAATTSGSSWCTASASSGTKGSATVKFSVTENSEYDDRSVSVTIKAGTASKTFTITQKSAEGLLVTTNKFEVAQEGGTIEVEVKANVDYQLEIAEASKGWISEANTRGLTAKTHKFSIAASEETEKREGEIYVKSGDKQEVIKVYQAGGAILMLSKDEIIVGDAGETISVDIKSNFEFAVQMPEVDWIVDEASTRGMSSHTLNYKVLPNETYDSRSSQIIFYDKNSSLRDTLNIIQAQKNAIILSQKEIEVEDEGGTISVEIKSNIEFDVEIPNASWLSSEASTRGLTSYIQKYNVAPNESEKSRSARIIFRDKNNNLCDTLTILQSEKRMLKLSRRLIEMDYLGGNAEIKVQSNVSYITKVDQSCSSWISCITTGALTESKVLLKVQMNKTHAIRTGYIYFDYGKNRKDTVKVIQTKNEITEIHVPEKGWLSRNFDSIGYKVSLKISGELNKYDMLAINKWAQGNTDRDSYNGYKGFQRRILLDMSDVTVTPNDGDPYIYISFNAGQYKTAVSSNVFQYFMAKTYIKHFICPKVSEYIEESAFYESNIESIEIGENIEGIAKNLDAFKGCVYLTSVTVHQKLSDRYDFSTCKNLSEVTFAEDCKSVKSIFKGCKKLTTVYLPSSAERIENRAFADCSSLQNIQIPNKLISIGAGAFSGTSITEFHLSDQIESIGKGAFADCTGLTKMRLPSHFTKIPSRVFSGCTNLSDVDLPNDITSIGDYAFEGCNLSELKFSDKVQYIGSGAFAGCPITEFEIPYNIDTIHDATFKDCKKLVKIKLPSHLTVIGEYAFYNCALTSFDIPKSVTSIGKVAFYNCPLTSIDIPESVTSIGDYTFSGCQLTRFDIPESITYLGNEIVRECKQLKDIYCYRKEPIETNNNPFSTGQYKNVILHVPKGTIEAYRHTNPWNNFYNVVEMDE